MAVGTLRRSAYFNGIRVLLCSRKLFDVYLMVLLKVGMCVGAMSRTERLRDVHSSVWSFKGDSKVKALFLEIDASGIGMNPTKGVTKICYNSTSTNA